MGKRGRKKVQYVERSKEELLESLVRQIANMRRSALAFDNGAMEEAERLASSVYILCADGSQQKSLLRVLNMRSRERFPDTGYRSKGMKIAFGPPLLCLWKEDGKLSYKPPLEGFRTCEFLRFGKWWEQSVFTNEHGRAISRRELTFYIRSTDGGAHVDKAHANTEYHDFSKNGGHVTWSEDKKFYSQLSVPQQNTHWQTMRQITWELDYVIKRLGL
ncbi:hypothetical protein HME9302_02163 [Alteripontixanthobacter maritimus]|uniref:Uncharacterized protein n=1 Tax=Alteripontixanthobacter maritimus TaxID=2161824 RepID=A0A369QCI0_9SPHN|nr:hypothetical protein [Alteripontixanthobacter maritimus]RDC60946.1 hypothetical protein HME9302_02163 [Alteripontixanthobacter maritimus]